MSIEENTENVIGEENITDNTSKKTYHFGEKLRATREKKHLTLKMVAQQAGVSESLVSQIERNRVSPAIDTLLTLANVLDINLSYLFEEYNRQRHVQVIRAGERRTVREDDITYEEVAHPIEEEGQNTIESYMITIPVGGQTHRGNYGHLGREMGFVLEGNAKLHYENNEYIINTGDSVSFSAGAPHTLENIGNTPLKAIWIVSPAQRFV